MAYSSHSVFKDVSLRRACCGIALAILLLLTAFLFAQRSAPALARPASSFVSPVPAINLHPTATQGTSLDGQTLRSDKPEITQGSALPSSDHLLPVVSLIGFGALLGGVISALKTR